MDHLKKYWVLGISCLLLTVSCTSTRNIAKDFNNYKNQVTEELVPDRTVNIFEAQLIQKEGRWLLQGETTLSSAREKMISFADQRLGKGHYRNQLTLLPTNDIMPEHYGIVRVSTAQLRAQPRHSAELLDQAIMGQTLRLLKQNGDWFLVQTEYDYIGWMILESFFRTDFEGLNTWSQAPKVRVCSNYAIVYSEPHTDAVPVTDVTLNASLTLKQIEGPWAIVTSPDGRQGWIKSNNVLPPGQRQSSLNQRASIIKTAVGLTGVPYLWGGNSSKASDCSGFVQTVFKANGIQLPRDARQQAGKGAEVIFSSDYAELMPGDLLFFGQDGIITHVAISLGGPRFIHQSGDVHINSLDPNDVDFKPSSKETLMTVKRIIPEAIPS